MWQKEYRMSTLPRHFKINDSVRNLPILCLSVLALGACSVELLEDEKPDIAAAQQPLIGGTVDTEDPGVVALTTISGNTSFCTGTLISPSVILTAAHCIDDLGSEPNAKIYFGSDIAGNGGISRFVRIKKQHPMWTGNLSGGHDIGMLVMDFPAAATT
jgi:hypothetical protein